MPMSRRAFAATVSAFAWLLATPAPATTSFSFSQVDYYQDGALAIADSAWGQFDIEYDQGSELQWFNVVLNPGTANAQWIVQNHPLLPSSVTGTSLFTSTSYFDLGVADGTAVSSLDIGYVVTAAPMTSTPGSFDGAGLYNVLDSQNILNAGVPSGNTALDGPVNDFIDWASSVFAGLKTTWHAGMPNVTQELNFCGPGAAANSLHWLAAEHGYTLPDIEDTQSLLALLMGNNNDGNWDDTQVEGKEDFIDLHDLPLKVHFAGGEKLAGGDALSWDWIESEMDKGQDVMLMTRDHWVVVEGTLSWGDVHLFMYRDDPFQHGDATTAAEQAVIDKRHVWSGYVDGRTSINGTTVLTAVATSPVPEPATWLMLVAGFAGIGGTMRGSRRMRIACRPG